jgi:conjugative transfer region protein (TIGR03750 family)
MTEAPEVPLADRVNVEPPIINGMSATEASFVFIGSCLIFAVVGVLLWVMTGFWPLSVGSLLIGPATTTWKLSKHLAVLKRNRPDGYHLQLIRKRLARWGLARDPFIRHSGWWSLGRSI